MANKIKLKRGLSTNISSLQLDTGELAVTTDTGELYVGDKDKHVVKINENTTYTLTKSGSTITLKGSDGSTQTVSDSNTTYSAATQSANGLMSSTDKTKLDGIATGANNYSLPTASSSTLGGVKVGTNLSISNGVLSATDTKYSAATTSAAGLMSASDKSKLNSTNIVYGTCDTAAGTAAKVITIQGNDNWALTTGSIVVVKFTNTNSASNVTLNVNGTGAKSIWYNNAAYTSSSNIVCGYAKRYTTYMYDGTYWVWLSYGTDANTTYTNVALGQGYATCDTAASTVAKVATLGSYALTANGIVAVKFTYDVPANATLNINSKGAKSIYHRGAAIQAGVIKAGDTATFIYNTNYHLISIDRSETVAASSTTPKANGTAAVGSETSFARGDHVHPAQTTITGNAGSATKVNNSLTLTKNNTNTTFNGSAAKTVSIPTIHYGTDEPDNSLGQDGDIYMILID
jgi:phage gp45-like